MTSVSGNVLDTYLGGKCYALAYALSSRFGWKIQAKIERYTFDGTEYAAHVWVLHPSGQAIDINGSVDLKEMIKGHGSTNGSVVEFSESEFLDFAEVDEEDEFDSFWDDVEEANAVINDYLIPLLKNKPEEEMLELR